MFVNKNDFKEISNILLRVRSMQISHVLIKNIFSSLSRRLYRKSNHFNIQFYPSRVRDLSKKISIRSSNSAIIHNPNPFFTEKTIKLKLAKGFIEFINKPSWNKSFDDDELFFSLHRWGWLLYELSSNSSKFDKNTGEALIRSWLYEMNSIPNGLASESYSTGERISNACLFYRHINRSWDHMPKDIIQAIHEMAFNLSTKIEYYPDELSGNHVINNAKAIYFAGYCCNDKNLINLAHAIFEDHLLKLVDKYGFLREGSSHYQFLFTRWILEVRMLADEKNDFFVLKIIDLVIKNMLNACNLLLINKNNSQVFFPLIGDISPDFDPDWLYSLMCSNLVGLKDYHTNSQDYAWSNLFKDYKINHAIGFKPKEFELNELESFSESEWRRIDFESWTAIFHVETPNGKALASHGHNDFGSILLFLDGEEVLIDSGRYNYTSSEIGNYGILANAHNSILLNGFPPILKRGDRHLPDEYRKTNTSVVFEKFEDRFKVSFTHDGFNRISDKNIIHTREYIFTNNSCEISDEISGKGDYFFECFFHFPDLIGISKIKSEIENNFFQLKVKMIEEKNNQLKKDFYLSSKNPIRGVRFLSYGEVTPAITQRLYGKIKLPFSQTHKLSRH